MRGLNDSNNSIKKTVHLEDDSSVISPSAAILAVIATFALFLVVGAGLLLFLGYPFALVSGELLLVVVPLGYMLHKRVDIKKYIGLEVTPKLFFHGMFIGGLLFIFDVAITSVLVGIFGTSEAIEEAGAIIEGLSSSQQGLLIVVSALLLAGICEEFTFRGFLQTAINAKYPSAVALLTSSLTFGLLHFDPQFVYSLSAFMLGLLFGYVYNRWHSYIVSAVAHGTLNIIVLAITLLLP